MVERNRRPRTALRQLDDINAVVIITLPIWHDGRIATVIADEKAGQLCDVGVLPRDNDKSISINRCFEFLPQRVEIRDTDAGIDRQTENDGRGLDRRQRPDVVVKMTVILLRLRGIGREDSIWPAK
jgi:hypothetical protein